MLKSLNNPPPLAGEFLKGLHAFKCDTPAKIIEWPDVRRGPIFKRSFNLADLDMDDLTANQVKALSVLQSYSNESVRKNSEAAGYVHAYFNEVQGYLDLKASINNE